ncbi:cyclin-dependent kinase 7-like, partial [Pempheris klunzingeri]|uniref:cyclin-dependent kinase 7-like n=1 Tax=Pempheris klunzingeri TaxID=3127111 RepID=UPI003980D603
MEEKPVKIYEKLECLGEGSYAKVFKARDKKTNVIVAIKKIKVIIGHGVDFCGINPTTIREIRFLKSIEHPYIIKLHHVMGDSLKISLIIDYMEGDLRNIIHSRTIAISQSHIKSYMKMMVDAISFMHSKWILHRDLKPENILIAPDGTIRITDFGLARIYGHFHDIEMTANVVTRWYRSPELLYGSTLYGEGVDVWALGCIFAELFLKAPLFPGDSDLSQLNEIFEKLGTPDESTWPGVSTLPDYIPYKKKTNIVP